MLDLKSVAVKIFLGALASVDIESEVRRVMRVKEGSLLIAGESIELSRFDEIVLIGFGKGSVRMGAALEKVLRDRVSRGLLVSDRRHPVPVRSRVLIASHPLPDASSEKAADEIISLIMSCNERSLIVFLISGGGSALIEKPGPPNLKIEDLRSIGEKLITSGATIHEINIVRKALSAIKGGGLGRLARQANARCVALYVSDVNEGDIKAIASNPILPEAVSAEDARTILSRYGLSQTVGAAPQEIEAGRSAMPLNDHSVEITRVLLENREAKSAAARIAASMGLDVRIEAGSFEDDYEQVARELLDRVLMARNQPGPDLVCQISGGEVKCKVRADGIGGRNSEFVLYCATLLSKLKGVRRVAVLSCGTDGIDGNSLATGAVADEATVDIGTAQGIDAFDHITRNDSHSFFKRLGGVVYSGPTGNNIRDMRILIAERSC